MLFILNDLFFSENLIFKEIVLFAVDILEHKKFTSF